MSGGPRVPFENPLVEWIDSRLPLFTIMAKEYGVFPTPKNFNYFWSFGGIAMTMLILMILTGIFLAMQYTPHADMAFGSVERIMRDVNYGWMLRYLHMNGASFFFIAVYIHIFRGLYYGSYKKPRELLWILGVLIFLLMMATAFMGYTLPWSQMGGWGATVITNLFSAIPVIGPKVVTLLWGGFGVENPTLNRFFALHYLLPFVIVGIVFLHVWALHVTGSNNPLGIDVKGPQDTLPFNPYYTAKDMFGLAFFMLAYIAVSFFAPNMLTHPDHFVQYNALQTPAHIVPEWYFLPFYAILRGINFGISPYIIASIGVAAFALWPIYTKGRELAVMGITILPEAQDLRLVMRRVFTLLGVAGFFFALGYLSQYERASGGTVLTLPFAKMAFIDAKFAGVLAMFGSIALLFVLPWLDSHPVRSARFRPQFKAALLAMVAATVVLGYVGAKAADAVLFSLGGFDFPMLWVGQLCTAYYFGFFLVIVPFLSVTEKAKDLPNSINEAVLKEKALKAEASA